MGEHQFPKLCGCGRIYENRERFNALRYCGMASLRVTRTKRAHLIRIVELRHCSCKSTIGVQVAYRSGAAVKNDDAACRFERRSQIKMNLEVES